MIQNKYIKSVKIVENGHYLIQINPKHAKKMERFFAFCDKDKYDNKRYFSDGLLEVFDRDSALTFLSTNQKILTEEVAQSIAHDLQFMFIQSAKPCPNLSFFKATNEEKISDVRLAMIKQWAEEYENPKRKYAQWVQDTFNKIFLVILPHDKRKKIKGTPFYESICGDNGKIENKIIQEQIGSDYKKFYDFRIYAAKLMNYPGSTDKLVKKPEELGYWWDILLTGEDNFRAIIHWLDEMIKNSINPLTNEPYTYEDMTKLKECRVALQESYSFLMESKLDYSPLTAHFLPFQ